MRDIVDGLIAWRARGEPFALATVVRTWSSAPRPPGAAMAVSASGEVLGSISGGCVEGETYALAREAIESGDAALARFGVSDEDAFATGLTCGGIIEVFVEPVGDDQLPAFDRTLDAIEGHRPTVVAAVTAGPGAGQRLALDEAGLTASTVEAADILLPRMEGML